MIQLKGFYNIEQIKVEIDYLVNEHGWWENEQISLQAPDKDFHEGSGRLEGAKFKENEYSHLNIPDDWQLSKFIKDHKLYRTRIMKLNPKTCYTVHRDKTPRVHLAIDTDPRCLFLLEDTAFHIPADGSAYYIDTTKPHTALNGTLDFERIHIVGCSDEVYNV